MDQLSLVVISAILNGVITATAIYIGFRKGTEKTVDVIIEKLRKQLGGSPTAQRLIKAIETSDKLFGDDQAIEQITRFFKSGAELLSSQEARNFFKNLSALISPANPPKIKKLKRIKTINS